MSFETAPKRGVAVHYGPRTIDDTSRGATASKDRVLTRSFDLTAADIDNPTAVNHGTYSGLHAAIPAGAKILSARVIVNTAFNGTTPTINVGFADSTGAELDFNGLVAAGSLAAVGVVAGAGVLVGDDLSADGYFYAMNTATDSTTGACTVVIEYVV